MLFVARLGKRPYFLLLLFCAVAASATYFSLGAGSYRTASPSSIGTMALPPADSVVDAGVSVPPLSEYSAVVARPLFSPTRRPSATATTSGSAAARTVSPIDVTFAGVIISDDEKIAIVRRDKTNKYLRLIEGDDVDGWRVQTIAADRLVLQRGSVVEELELALKPPPGALPERQAQRPPRSQESDSRK